MSRIVLTGTTIKYIGTNAAGTGAFGGTTGLTPDYPSISDAVSDAYANYDFAGQQVEWRLLDGNVLAGVNLSGQFVGQRSPPVIRASQMGSPGAIIQPPAQHAALEMSNGAAIAIADLEMDNAYQFRHFGTEQDLILIGQGAHLYFWGSNRIIQRAISHNGISIVGGSVDQLPQSWGSGTVNGGHLHWVGTFQCGIQTDALGTFAADANGQHGIVAWWFEGDIERSTPGWCVSFLDVGPLSEIHVDGVDFHAAGAAGANGYAYRVRGGGILYTNDVQDPAQKNNIPGSARNLGPIQGYII